LGKKPQHARSAQPKVSLDSTQDFYELTQLKIANPNLVKTEKERLVCKNVWQVTSNRRSAVVVSNRTRLHQLR